MKIHIAIIALLCVLISQGSAYGQTATGQVCQSCGEQSRPLRFDIGDAAYVGGSIADVSTSIGKREGGVFKNDQGRFAAGPNIGYKLGLWGGIKFLEYKYPEHRRAFVWTKIAIGAAFGFVAWHNSQVKR